MIKKVELCIGEKYYRRYIFTEEQEQEVIKECDKMLKENEANDGCDLTTLEDYIAVNSVLAKKYNDPYNMNNFMIYLEDDEAKEELITELSERFCEHNWSDSMLQSMAEDMGIAETIEN